ncbi:hypothetical protein R8Z50_07745 [Longispora sp. K20-0274]|uniref:HEAT repeat domain-containing protein n=1 Tax=Longispora sp. K20-0274 TaxID=3088255 RepID=UPI0039995C1E
MLCREVYQGGCDRPIEGPGWLHPEHWPVLPDDRPILPSLRHDVPDHLIRTLVRSPEPYVRRAVITAPQTADDVVDALLDDPREDVRTTALHTTRSADTLRSAAGDPRLRFAVACNPHCPPDVLERLSRDNDPDVRNRVVINPATPDHLIDAATRDRHLFVRWWALRQTRNARIIDRAARSSDPDEREWVASNPHCSPETLLVLAADPDWQVRRKVASNENCPGDLRARLIGEPIGAHRPARYPSPTPSQRAGALVERFVWPLILRLWPERDRD